MAFTNHAEAERHYDRKPGEVFEATRALAREQARWTEVLVHPDSLRLSFEARTWLFRFVDDVSFVVSADPAGGSRLAARSASRVGKSDLGANGRRLASFLGALDERLTGAH